MRSSCVAETVSKVTASDGTVTKDDGQVVLDDESPLAEQGFLHRAAQLRVYVCKEGSNGPVSRVNLPNNKLEDVTVSVKADSPGHRRAMAENGAEMACQIG